MLSVCRPRCMLLFRQRRLPCPSFHFFTSKSGDPEDLIESGMMNLAMEQNRRYEQPAIVQIRVEPEKTKILRTKDGDFKVTAVSARLYGDIHSTIPQEAVTPLRPWTDFLVWQNRLVAALATCPTMRDNFSPYIEVAYTTGESHTPLRQVTLSRPFELRMARYLRMVDTVKKSKLSNEEFFHYMFGTLLFDLQGKKHDRQSKKVSDDFVITREADESGKLSEVASPLQGLVLAVGEEDGEQLENKHFSIYLNSWIYLHKLSVNGPMWFSTGQGIRMVAGVSPHDRVESYDCKLEVSEDEMFKRSDLLWFDLESDAKRKAYNKYLDSKKNDNEDNKVDDISKTPNVQELQEGGADKDIDVKEWDKYLENEAKKAKIEARAKAEKRRKEGRQMGTGRRQRSSRN